MSKDKSKAKSGRRAQGHDDPEPSRAAAAISPASVAGLGLRRIGQSVLVADTAENRGMINAASHMLKVESA